MRCRNWLIASGLFVTIVTVTGSAAAQCVGDCDGGQDVTVNEIIKLVNIALGTQTESACPNGIPSGAGVEVNVVLILQAVSNALYGCGSTLPTPTSTHTNTPTTSPTQSPTPTVTSSPTPACLFDLASNIPDGSALCIYVGGWNAQCGTTDLVATFMGNGISLVVGILTDPLVFFGGTVISPTEVRMEVWFTDPDVDLQDISGTISLTDDHAVLRVAPSAPPFTVEGCPFVAYQGTFVGLSSPSAGPAIVARDLPTMFRSLRWQR